MSGMPPLFACITRLNPKDGLDFYEWKEKYLGSSEMKNKLSIIVFNLTTSE